jgi:hypothetical protein
MDASVSYVPLGFAQATGVSAAANLPGIGSPAAIPQGAYLSAVIVVELEDFRWRDDGVDPTSGVGELLPKNTEFVYSGRLSALRLIPVTGSGTIDVSYYRNAG